MKNTAYKIAVFCGVMVCSWLLLSFYFFPIKAGPENYPSFSAFFSDAVRHIAAIKLIISLIFSIFALFAAELREEKKRKVREALAKAEIKFLASQDTGAVRNS